MPGTPEQTTAARKSVLAGECYRRWTRGESMSDEQVEAATTTTIELAKALGQYGPGFGLATAELARFATEMQLVWQARLRERYELCGAYYGEGRTNTRGAVCGRPAGHPPVSKDGVGHSPYFTPADRQTR